MSAIPFAAALGAACALAGVIALAAELRKQRETAPAPPAASREPTAKQILTVLDAYWPPWYADQVAAMYELERTDRWAS